MICCRNSVSHCATAERLLVELHVHCLLSHFSGGWNSLSLSHLLGKRGHIKLDFLLRNLGLTQLSLPSAWGGPLGDMKRSSFSIRKSLLENSRPELV